MIRVRPRWPVMMVLLLCTGCDGGSGAGGDTDTSDVVDVPQDTLGADTAPADTAHDPVQDSTPGDVMVESDAEPPEFDCSLAGTYSNPAPGEVGHTEVARWKGDRSAALTINFDDSTPGQALRGVPAMVSHDLTGTWFVNPGVDSYADHSDVWETDAPAGGQELANHTMDHAGATDEEDARYQIGEAVAVILAAYPSGRSPLMAFNRGGGTTWGITEEQIQDLLAEYHCIERVHSTGIYPATPGETMLTEIRDHLSSGGWADDWGNVHFHGICDPADTVNCVCDTPGTSSNCREYGDGVNNGAVSLTDFSIFLDGLTTDEYFTSDVWIAGFIAAHKYQAERNDAQVVMIPDTDERIALCVTSTLDATLYDEPLTMMTEVPGTWTSCVATQAGVTLPCAVEDSTATFEARPSGDAVVLGQG